MSDWIAGHAPESASNPKGGSRDDMRCGSERRGCEFNNRRKKRGKVIFSPGELQGLFASSLL